LQFRDHRDELRYDPIPGLIFTEGSVPELKRCQTRGNEEAIEWLGVRARQSQLNSLSPGHANPFGELADIIRRTSSGRLESAS
jgi:hypothetical protein